MREWALAHAVPLIGGALLGAYLLTAWWQAWRYYRRLPPFTWLCGSELASGEVTKVERVRGRRWLLTVFDESAEFSLRYYLRARRSEPCPIQKGMRLERQPCDCWWYLGRPKGRRKLCWLREPVGPH
jgi:hypothetical protein